MIINPSEIVIEGMLDGEKQVQGGGIDLSVGEIARFSGTGAIDFDNSRRSLPEAVAIAWESSADASPGAENEYIDLSPGGYLVRYNETVTVPNDALGIILPRSSLMRAGATLAGAVWDPGYSGRGQGLLTVTNPIRIYRNARIGQIFFIRLESSVARLYTGKYQDEGK